MVALFWGFWGYNRAVVGLEEYTFDKSAKPIRSQGERFQTYGSGLAT